MDDCSGLGKCRIKTRDVRADLCNAGFVVKEDKWVWGPTQVLDWLGIIWNSALGSLGIVERRIVKIINSIDRIIDADFQVSERELASFTGQIIIPELVVGNIGRIMTRHCVLSTLCRDNWIILYPVSMITARKHFILEGKYG